MENKDVKLGLDGITAHIIDGRVRYSGAIGGSIIVADFYSMDGSGTIESPATGGIKASHERTYACVRHRLEPHLIERKRTLPLS